MSRLRDIARQIKRKFKDEDEENFLSNVKGVIHVGANLGQEKELYRHYNLNVLWIEPIPGVFKKLKENLKGFTKQNACQYLVTDRDGESYQFNIANNEGQSSSIFELGSHKDIWPDVNFIDKINLTSSTLSTIIERENIQLDHYDTLILDTQGSELLVLKGTESLLKHFTYIKTEAADFPAYKNCCLLNDLDQYLYLHNFKQISKEFMTQRDQGGNYFDVIYKQSS